MDKLTQKKYLNKFRLTLDCNTFTGEWSLQGEDPDIDIYFGTRKPGFKKIQQAHIDTMNKVKKAVEELGQWEINALNKCNKIIKELIKELKEK